MKRLAMACALALVLVLPACGKLESATVVDSVRVLGIQADPPYALPGSAVALDALVVDGRADQSTPLVFGWAPAPCVDPHGDAYYGCFPAFAGATQADLVLGSAWSFDMPANAITRHASDPSYGLAYVYFAACAGQLAAVPRDPNAAANTLPMGCFDDHGAAAGSDAFVFAFAPVYAFADRTNNNPVIDHLELDGAPVDPVAGITLDACDQKCPKHSLETVVPMASWELDPADIDADGTELHEEIRADYYATGVAIDGGSVELYDPRTGASSIAIDHITAPAEPGAYTLWAVVHDNRGGVSWLAVPIHVQ